MREAINMRGQVTLLIKDKKGRIIQKQEQKNRIVRDGRYLVAHLFGGITSGTPPSKVTHMGIGTDGTAPGDDNQNLGSPRGLRKPIETVEYEDFDEEDQETKEIIKRVRTRLTSVFDFGEANDPAVPLREAAIFTAETGGTMYNRVVFDDVTKTDAFKLTLFWEIIF